MITQELHSDLVDAVLDGIHAAVWLHYETYETDNCLPYDVINSIEKYMVSLRIMTVHPYDAISYAEDAFNEANPGRDVRTFVVGTDFYSLYE